MAAELLDGDVVQGVGVGADSGGGEWLFAVGPVDEADSDSEDGGDDVVVVLLPLLPLLLPLFPVSLAPELELRGLDDTGPVIVADFDEDPLPVGLSVVVELRKGVPEILVCVALGDTFVPLADAELMVSIVLTVNVLLETVVVAVDAVFEPDIEPVGGVVVSRDEFDCPLTGVEALEAEAEPRLEEGALVSLPDASLRVWDNVIDPDSEPIPDISLDGLPVTDDAGNMLVVVIFQDIPSVQLEVATVVLEFHKPLEVTMLLFAGDISLLVDPTLIELEAIVTVEVTVGLFVSVLVIVLVVNESVDPLLPVPDPEATVLLSSEPGRLLWVVVSEDVPVVLGPAPPDEALTPEVMALLETGDDTLLLIDVIAVELGELPLTLLEIPVGVDNADSVSLPEGTEGVPEMMKVEVPAVAQLRTDEVIFILDEPFEEVPAHPLEVGGIPESDGPDEDTEVIFPLVTEDVELVTSVVTVSVHIVGPDDAETFWRLDVTTTIEVAVTETVALLEIVVPDNELLDPPG